MRCAVCQKELDPKEEFPLLAHVEANPDCGWSENERKLKAELRETKLQNRELYDALFKIVGIMQGSQLDKEVLEQVYGIAVDAIALKRNDLGLDFATYEAAKKEQAQGKRIPIDDAIKQKGHTADGCDLAICAICRAAVVDGCKHGPHEVCSKCDLI